MTRECFAQLSRAGGPNLAELVAAKRNQDSEKEPP